MATHSKGFTVFVKTGDMKGAGTNANIWITLHDEDGQRSSKVALNNFFRDDFERGSEDRFEISSDDAGNVQTIKFVELERDNWGFGSEWFVDRVTVENNNTGKSYVFPLHRWLRADCRHMIIHLDTSLPQQDDNTDQRRALLEDKQTMYELAETDGRLPVGVKELPPDEEFSFSYTWDIEKLKLELLVKTKYLQFVTGHWDTLEDVKNIYTLEALPLPKDYDKFQEDTYFGFQRMNGLSPMGVERCVNIPPKLAVTDAMLAPFLEGLTLQQALHQKRLFAVNHDILHEFPCKTPDLKVCAPIALLFVNSQQKLVPVAIQLFQDPGPDNPVFLPSDDHYTWMLAKMWFNNAEGTIHQSLTHLGFTHLLMESFSLATHRHLAQSHPIFKLLLPHFLYLMAINNRAVKKLLSVDGWVDVTMSVGRDGVLELVRRGVEKWRLDVDGTLPADLKRRGTDDASLLPGYYYRDDAILLYEAIRDYVTEYIELYYDSDAALVQDHEIQAWVAELAKDKSSGGFGIKGIPGEGKLSTSGDLVLVLTSIIFTCSVQHAAVNFPQYQMYASPTSYPLTVRGMPPSDKKPRSEKDIVAALPSKEQTLNTMIIATILSRKGTNSLGYFEMDYIVDPKAHEVVHSFRKRLDEVRKIIHTRNETRQPDYPYLDPTNIPNSIAV